MPAAQRVFVELMSCTPVSGGHARVFLLSARVGPKSAVSKGSSMSGLLESILFHSCAPFITGIDCPLVSKPPESRP